MPPTSAIIECEKCKNRINVELIFDLVESDNDREMGSEAIHTAEDLIKCNCGKKISYTRTIFEYPLGAFDEPFDKISGGKFLD